MTKDKEKVSGRISSVEKYLKRLGELKIMGREQIIKREELLDSLVLNLYYVTQTTIDLADSVISYRGLRQPTSLSEHFEVLYEDKIIDRDLTERLVNMAKFRNVLAHNYGKLDYDKVFENLYQNLGDIQKFLDIISKKY